MQTLTTMPKLFRLEQVEAAYGIRKDRLKRLARNGYLNVVRFGVKDIRVKESELARFLHDGCGTKNPLKTKKSSMQGKAGLPQPQP